MTEIIPQIEEKEVPPYKLDTFYLRLKIGTCPHFCPQTTTN